MEEMAPTVGTSVFSHQVWPCALYKFVEEAHRLLWVRGRLSMVDYVLNSVVEGTPAKEFINHAWCAWKAHGTTTQSRWGIRTMC